MDFRPSRRRRNEPELDLTPLIDVVFLLLVFFLVTATFAQHQAQSTVPVDLPEGATGEAAGEAERVTIHVTAEGAMRIERAGEPPIDAPTQDALRAALADIALSEPGTPIYLRGDQNVPYGVVMGVLDAAREVGFRQVYNVVHGPSD